MPGIREAGIRLSLAHSRIPGCLLCAALLCAAARVAAEDAPDSLARLAEAIELPERAPESVKWAAGELLAVLARQKVPGAALPGHGAIKVNIAAPAGADPAQAPAAVPEAYVLHKHADGWTVTGHDATGAMYGVMELAERLAAVPAAADWPAFFAAAEPARGAPQVAFRAENIFLHLNPDGTLANWFFDEAYWTGYLALLARSRINVLDIHGVYTPASTIFGNMLHVFTGGNGGPQAANLAMLRRIVALAAARGVRVALMNYHAGPRAGMTDTAARVQEFVKGVPGLWLLGLRVKREGDEALDAFEQGFLRPAQAAGFAGGFYTRSWGTDEDAIRGMARLCQDKLYVELKFNGEHLGLPYPAIQGWGEDYSYEGYLKQPRSFEVLWQIRANGTHRVFPWGDPDFVRRAVAGMQMGGAKGFSLEAPTAYFAPETAARYRSLNGPDAPRYLHELHGAWRMLWGRLAYDPATSDAVFERAFAQRHGAAAGSAAFQTLARASKIVPHVYASYAMGVDHRDAAPELEIGAATRDMKDGWRGLDELCAIQPLDRARYASPLEFAQAVAAGDFDARIGPLEAAARLETEARAAERAGQDLAALVSQARHGLELETLAREAQALAALGRSHAERLRALTCWALWTRTQDARWLVRARERLVAAAAQWKILSELADAVYLPVNDPLRMGNGYTWASQLPQFDRLVGQLDKQLGKQRKKKPRLDGEPDLRAEAAERAMLPEPQVKLTRKKGQAVLELHFPRAAPARLELGAAALDSRAAWTFKEMDWDEKRKVFRGEAKDGELLFVRGCDAEGRAWLWPDPEKALPFIGAGSR